MGIKKKESRIDPAEFVERYERAVEESEYETVKTASYGLRFAVERSADPPRTKRIQKTTVEAIEKYGARAEFDELFVRCAVAFPSYADVAGFVRSRTECSDGGENAWSIVGELDKTGVFVSAVERACVALETSLKNSLGTEEAAGRIGVFPSSAMREDRVGTYGKVSGLLKILERFETKKSSDAPRSSFLELLFFADELFLKDRAFADAFGEGCPEKASEYAFSAIVNALFRAVEKRPKDLLRMSLSLADRVRGSETDFKKRLVSACFDAVSEGMRSDPSVSSDFYSVALLPTAFPDRSYEATALIASMRSGKNGRLGPEDVRVRATTLKNGISKEVLSGAADPLLGKPVFRPRRIAPAETELLTAPVEKYEKGNPGLFADEILKILEDLTGEEPERSAMISFLASVGDPAAFEALVYEEESEYAEKWARRFASPNSKPEERISPERMSVRAGAVLYALGFSTYDGWRKNPDVYSMVRNAAAMLAGNGAYDPLRLLSFLSSASAKDGSSDMKRAFGDSSDLADAATKRVASGDSELAEKYEFLVRSPLPIPGMKNLVETTERVLAFARSRSDEICV